MGKRLAGYCSAVESYQRALSLDNSNAEANAGMRRLGKGSSIF